MHIDQKHTDASMRDVDVSPLERRLWAYQWYVWERLLLCRFSWSTDFLHFSLYNFLPFHLPFSNYLTQYSQPSKPSQSHLTVYIIVCTNIRTTFNLTTLRPSKLTTSISLPFNNYPQAFMMPSSPEDIPEHRTLRRMPGVFG